MADEIHTALALLNSMVLSGENHTARSERLVENAFIELKYRHTPSVSDAAKVLPKCVGCERIIDPREEVDGGDTFGCQISDNRWVCSTNCYDQSLAEQETDG